MHLKLGKNLSIGLAAGCLVAVLFSFGGYLLVREDRMQFGAVMFLLVPFVTGFVVSAVTRRPHRIAGCCIVGSLITLTALFMLGWEGIVCIAMALPLLATGMTVGAVTGYCIIGRIRDRKAGLKTTLLIVLIGPFFIAAADRVERPYRSVQQTEVFKSKVVIAATPSEAWKSFTTISSMSGSKPFLLRVGLPIPQQCFLEGTGVDAKRACHFHNGVISQVVTKWDEPSTIELKIIGSTLPGRHWLSFQNAGYQLIPTERGTLLVRHTIIGTRLYPRWYWRPLEEWGVVSEHNYVLQNIKRIAEERRK